MPLAQAYDVEYNNTLLADGVNRHIVQARVFDSAEIRVSDKPVGQGDGMYPGRDLYGSKTIELTIEVWGENEAQMYASYYPLLAAVVKQPVELPLTMRLPQWPADLRVMCRPRRVGGLVVDKSFDLFTGQVTIQFVATSPLAQSNTLSSQTVNLTAVSGGLAFPLAYPRSYGGLSTSNVVNATNLGTYAAPWKATIAGPITNPSIEHVEQGLTLSFVGVVNSGETLVVETGIANSVLLNGTASRYSWVVDSSKFFKLNPGVNSVRFNGTTAGSPTMTFEWRSTWII